MKKLAILSIIIILPLFSCTSPEKAAKSRYDKALSLNEDGRQDKALELLESIIADYPESPYGNHGKSVLYEKEDLIYEAIDANHKVLKDHPDFLPALEMNARLALKVERPAMAYFATGLYYENGGDLATGSSIEARCFFDAGKIGDAGRMLDTLKDRLGENPIYLMDLAEYLRRSNKLEQAFKVCDSAFRAAQNDGAVFVKVADFFRSMGLIDSALFYYNMAVPSTEEDSYLLLDIAEALIDMKYFRDAGKLLEKFAQKSGETHKYHLLRARILSGRGNNRMAAQEYGKVLQKYPQIPTVYSNFAEFKGEGGDRRGGQMYGETAVEIASLNNYPNLAKINLELRVIESLVAMDRLNQAGPMAEAMADTLKSDFRAQYNAAYLYWYAGAHDTLLTERYDRMDSAAVGVPVYMAKAADFHLRIDSLQRAYNIFSEVLKTDKLNVTAIKGLMGVWTKRKAPSRALEFINGYDEYVSYIPEIAYAKLALYEELGEYQSALQFAERLTDIAGKDLSRYKRLIDLENQRGSKDRVAEIYQKCLDTNSDNPDAYFMAGRYYFIKGDFDRALELAAKALEYDSTYADGYKLRADVAAERGKTDEAIALYEKAEEFNQYADDAIGARAMLMLLKGEDPMVVLNLARRATNYDGADPHHYYVQGRALYKAEKYSMARTQYEYALKFAPEDPVYNFYAGLNYIKDGQPISAEECFKTALKNGLSGELKTEAEKALKNL